MNISRQLINKPSVLFLVLWVHGRVTIGNTTKPHKRHFIALRNGFNSGADRQIKHVRYGLFQVKYESVIRWTFMRKNRNKQIRICACATGSSHDLLAPIIWIQYMSAVMSYNINQTFNMVCTWSVHTFLVRALSLLYLCNRLSSLQV